jgi:hypothetical protein
MMASLFTYFLSLKNARSKMLALLKMARTTRDTQYCLLKMSKTWGIMPHVFAPPFLVEGLDAFFEDVQSMHFW